MIVYKNLHLVVSKTMTVNVVGNLAGSYLTIESRKHQKRPESLTRAPSLGLENIFVFNCGLGVFKGVSKTKRMLFLLGKFFSETSSTF